MRVRFEKIKNVMTKFFYSRLTCSTISAMTLQIVKPLLRIAIAILDFRKRKFRTIRLEMTGNSLSSPVNST